MERHQLAIGGRWIDAVSQRGFERRSPFTGEVATVSSAARAEDVVAAVDAAAVAFPAWSQSGPTQRRELLNRAADLILERRQKLVETMVAETGATIGWSQFNVDNAALMLREAAAMTTQIAGEVIPTDVPDNLALAVRQPVGVCVGIAPWNAPMILCARAFAMPLACGNTVVVKGSEMCPGLHAQIVGAVIDAGLDKGEINLINHDAADGPEVVDALIAHPGVRRINFTGSTRVGRIIAQKAAAHLKPVLLELGGKAPLVVLDDADLDAAVDAAIFGAFMNQGQICMSTEKIVVVDAVADDFVSRFTARAGALVAGDPTSQVHLGAVVDAHTIERMADLIGDARAKGAVVHGGHAEGNVMSPAVVDRVTAAMRIYSEESFGPAVSVVRVADEARALEVANDTEYGLSAAVFSRDIGRALAFARKVRSGICHINAPTVHDEPQMPFGGTKASGYGRFGGRAGIAEFTELRWITIQTGPRHYPF
jgi:acyl-CoA reductase-like NAD-dependent aldehyde dehydrogenase